MMDNPQDYVFEEDGNNQELDEPETDRKPSMTINELYNLLDEKNAAIDQLKRRLTNQQVQLSYYLRKHFEQGSVGSFSNECVPDLADDNVQLCMAMYKFIRDTGRKSRLSILQDRLEEYDKRVQGILEQQENFIDERLGMGSGWLRDCTENMQCDDESDEMYEEEEFDNICYKDRAIQIAHMDFCRTLILNINKVREELKQFRICAEQISELETERNALVEQVYSLTSEERFNAVCVNAIQEEQNLELEQQNSEEEDQQETSNNLETSLVTGGKASDADDSETEAALSIENIYTAQQKPSEELRKMLSSIQIETIKVMLLSKKQRQKFSSELHTLRKENNSLKQRLRAMEELTTNKSMLELQQKCFRIGKDIQDLHRCLETDSAEKDKELQRMMEELQVRCIETNKLKREVAQLRVTITALQTDRDSLQRRLEINESMKSNCKVTGAESQQIKDLNHVVSMQEKQIKDLLGIISKINSASVEANQDDYRGKAYKKRKNRSGEEVCLGESSKVEQAKHSGNKIPKIRCVENIECEVQGAGKLRMAANDCDETYSTPMPPVNVSSKSFFSAASSTTLIDEHLDYLYSKSNPVSEHNGECEERRSLETIVHEDHSRNDGLHSSKRITSTTSHTATTSLRLELCSDDGKSESVQAVLECTPPHDGCLEMRNSSKLRLRLECSSPSRGNHNDMLHHPGDRSLSNFAYSERDVTGDLAKNTNATREARIQLTNQLEKMKSELERCQAASQYKGDAEEVGGDS